jgi:hypothetical protein
MSWCLLLVVIEKGEDVWSGSPGYGNARDLCPRTCRDHEVGISSNLYR